MYFSEVQLISERPLGPDGKLIKVGGVILRSPNGVMVEQNSRVICASITKHFGKRVENPNFWKLNIFFDSSRTDIEFTVSSGILNVYKKFRMDLYFDLKSSDRMDFLFNYIMECLGDVFNKFSLNSGILSELNSSIDRSSMDNTFSGKVMISPNGKCMANIEINQSFECSVVCVRVIGRDFQKIITIEKTSPDEFDFQIFLGSLTWIDSGNLLLTRVDGKEYRIEVK